MADPFAGFDLPEDMVDLETIVPYPNLLVFSKPKAGKTTWACSDDKILLLNAESGGDVSAARSDIKGSHIKQWPIPKYDDFENALNWLKNCADRKGKIPFNWVVFDTITTFQDRQLMRFVMEKMHARRPDRNLWIPDKPEYFENQQILVQRVKELCDLPVGIIILAHTMEKTDGEGEEFYYPQIQGGGIRVAQQILAGMTSYGYMYVKTRVDKDKKPVIHSGKPVKDRYIMWEDFKKMQGGDRLGVLGQFTKNVTLKEIRLLSEARNKEIEEQKGKK